MPDEMEPPLPRALSRSLEEANEEPVSLNPPLPQHDLRFRQPVPPSMPTQANPMNLRLPHAGELVIGWVEEDVAAEIDGGYMVTLFKGSAIGYVIKASRSMIWADPVSPQFEVELEGGGISNVHLKRAVAQGAPWIWDRVQG